jgi:hypothetical protein
LQTWGVISLGEKLAPVNALLLPVVPSATHPLGANPVVATVAIAVELVELVVVVVVVVLVDDDDDLERKSNQPSVPLALP